MSQKRVAYSRAGVVRQRSRGTGLVLSYEQESRGGGEKEKGKAVQKTEVKGEHSWSM